jgi:hypothetical protein
MMQRVRCPRENCQAIYPAGAAFCPRCGRPNPRPRRQFRGFPWILILLAFFVVRHCAHRSNPNPPAPASTQNVATPALDVQSALSSVESFSQARQNCNATAAGKRQFTGQIAGRYVRWTGVLKHSLIQRSSTLIGTQANSRASIRLMPATDEVKRQLRSIESGSQVEIEGVLLDEQGVHVTNIRAADSLALPNERE